MIENDRLIKTNTAVSAAAAAERVLVSSREEVLNAPEAAAGKHGHLEAAFTLNRLMLIELNAHHRLHVHAMFV